MRTVNLTSYFLTTVHTLFPHSVEIYDTQSRKLVEAKKQTVYSIYNYTRQGFYFLTLLMEYQHFKRLRI